LFQLVFLNRGYAKALLLWSGLFLGVKKLCLFLHLGDSRIYVLLCHVLKVFVFRRWEIMNTGVRPFEASYIRLVDTLVFCFASAVSCTRPSYRF
jgi:hypothetical protein